MLMVSFSEKSINGSASKVYYPMTEDITFAEALKW